MSLSSSGHLWCADYQASRKAAVSLAPGLFCGILSPLHLSALLQNKGKYWALSALPLCSRAFLLFITSDWRQAIFVVYFALPIFCPATVASAGFALGPNAQAVLGSHVL